MAICMCMDFLGYMYIIYNMIYSLWREYKVSIYLESIVDIRQ